MLPEGIKWTLKLFCENGSRASFWPFQIVPVDSKQSIRQQLKEQCIIFVPATILLLKPACDLATVCLLSALVIYCIVMLHNKDKKIFIIEVGWRLTFVQVFSAVIVMLSTFCISHGIYSDSIYLCPGQLLPVIFSRSEYKLSISIESNI